MAGDATTIPLQDAPLAEMRGGTWRGRVRELADRSTRAKVGAVALSTIVALSLLLVMTAADRPSWLASTTHTGFFPHWLAGPLGGLWPAPHGGATTLKYEVTAAIVLMYASYLVLLRCVPELRARWLVVSIVAVHVIFVLSPPLTLTDIFNYINYGRMEVVHGLNPYTTIPVLEPHSDPSYVLSNWHELRSPYGPLFTMLTLIVVPLGVAGSFWALKLIVVGASLGTVLLVWECARLLGRDQLTAVALVGLNPIMLVWGLGGDHNDALMVLFVMLGFYLLLRARAQRAGSDRRRPGVVPPGWWLALSPFEIGAGAAFAFATAIKASGGLLIPLVLVSLLRAPRALIGVVLGMLGAGVLVGAVSLLIFGLHIPDLSTQSHVVSNESVPNLIGLALGLGGETEGLRMATVGALVLVVLLCCRLAWRRGEAISASGWANVALLFTLSWVLPWYVLWALPLAALSGSRRLRTTVLVAGAYLIVAWAPASSLLWNAIGFHPESTSVGRLHQRSIKELLN